MQKTFVKMMFSLLQKKNDKKLWRNNAIVKTRKRLDE